MSSGESSDRLTSTRFFIEDIQRGGFVAAHGVASPLPPRLVTRLVGVPQLAAVVAELRVASLAAAAQLGALGAAVGDYSVAAGRQNIISVNTHVQIPA